MATRLYHIYCQHCSYKKLTDGSDFANLIEVKTCKDCGGLRQFKCPKCGYLLRVSKARTSVVDESQKQIEKIREDQKEKLDRRKAAQRRVLKERQRQNDDDGATKA